MLARITAIEHHALATSGKTRPSLVVCERPDQSVVEVVAKFSAGCEEKETSLAREVVAGCLAADLGLPIPEPFLIDVPAGWRAAVDDPGQRARVGASSPVAFGSQLVTGGFAVWDTGRLIDDTLLPTAAAVFAFDLITQNIDRRSENPNCLVRAHEIRIFDHELAFTHGVVIGWRPPWVVGGLKDFETPGRHIFREGLLNRPIDFVPIRAAWANLPDARLAEYEAAIPAEWKMALPAVQNALRLIRDARDHIDACLTEVKRVLT